MITTAIWRRNSYRNAANLMCAFLRPSDSPIEIYWRYLVGNNVCVVPLHSGHVDMFTREHLDEFIADFYAADDGANSINQKPSSILRA